jgi:hypothetical protein
MLHIACLQHQKDTGNTLVIGEVTLRHLVREHIGETVFGLLNQVGFEWAYKVRWGPVDPEFGIADKSLGCKLFAFGQWAANGFQKYTPAREVASFPVTPEWVREHLPKVGWPFNSDDPDAEDEETTP